MSSVDPKRALELLAAGGVDRLQVRGTVRLTPDRPVARLPEHFEAVSLIATGCTWLKALPRKLLLTSRLDVSGCFQLAGLPAELSCTSVVMRDCTGIEALPEGIALSFLDATGCTALSRWPARGSFRHGHLLLRGCISLRGLPDWIESVARLDLAGCRGISELPEQLRVGSFLDLADTAITHLPAAWSQVPLRWRGAPIDERIAFRPETITAREVLEEPNLELRRAKLGRMGYARFVVEAGAVPIDEDRDAGGPRRLLRVELGEDEPLVCLSVSCPSTGRQYLLRVPPTMQRCHDAAAWIAGFDDPSAYAPEIET